MSAHLELGDLIQFDTENELLQNTLFLVHYIDKNVLELVTEAYNEIISIPIHKNAFVDTSIQNVRILKRPEKKGYASQNGFEKGVWIDIRFQMISQSITGLILDKESDMIEVEVYPMKEVIYLNFGYKGLLKSIQSIAIREIPDWYVENMEDGTENILNDDKEENSNNIQQAEIEQENFVVSKNKNEDNINEDELQNQEQDEVFEDLDSGFDEFVEYVEVTENERKYDIESQKEDLLNDILSYLPESTRTSKKLSSIQTIIDRYEELYEQYYGPEKYKSTDDLVYLSENPLKKKISLLDLPTWIIPVVKNRRYVYSSTTKLKRPDIEILDFDEDTDIIIERNEDYPDRDKPFTYPFYDIGTLTTVSIHKPLDVMMKTHSVVNRNKLYVLEQTSKNIFRYVENDPATITGFTIQPMQYIMNQVQPTTPLYKRIDYQNRFTLKNLKRKKICLDATCTTSFIRPNKPLHHYISKTQTAIVTDIDDPLKTYTQYNVPEVKDQIRLIQPYIKVKDALNLHSLLIRYGTFYLETRHIHIDLYPYVNAFIQSNVQQYEAYIKNIFKSSYKIQSLEHKNRKNNVLTDLFLNTPEEEIFSLYEVDNIANAMSDSELYDTMKQLDYGELLAKGIAMQDIEVHTDMNIHDIVKKKMENIENENERKSSGCAKKIIAKEYKHESELQFDNSKNIVFDAHLEQAYLEYVYNGQYDVFKDSLPDESMQMDEYRDFILNRLTQYTKVNKDLLEYEAESIIQGERFIKDGFYAVLRTSDNELDKYYERQQNVWVINETIDPLQEGELFCLVEAKCSTKNSGCDSLENIQNIITKDSSEGIYNHILSEQLEQEKQTESSIRLYFTKYAKALKKKIANQTNRYKVKDTPITNVEENIKSPFETLRSVIMQLPFAKKMQYLDIFIHKITRKALMNYEDTDWLYCVKTNKPLLPVFYETIVQASRKSSQEYECVITKIIDTRGKREGGIWVDKYSGFKIADIQVVHDNEYYSSVIHENIVVSKTSNIKLDSDSVTIHNIFEYFMKHVGVKLDNIPELTVMVLNVLKKNHGTFDRFHALYKKKYAKNKKADISKEKVHKKYINIKNQYILITSALYFLIVAQTSIPRVKPRVSFPGCKKSFSGFPIYNQADYTGMKYMICVLKRTAKESKKNKLWSSVHKLENDEIIQKMKYLYTNEISKEPVVKNWKINKLKYNETEPEQTEKSQLKWYSFVPNLQMKHHLSQRRVVSPFENRFFDNAQQQIQKGDKKQDIFIHLMQSKMRQLANEIQYEIYQITNQQNMLLYTGNQPYLENMCCQKSFEYQKPCMQFFIDKNKKIEEYLFNIRRIENVVSLNFSSTLSTINYSNVNQVNINQFSIDVWSNDSIYYLYFNLCRISTEEIPNTLCSKVVAEFEKLKKAKNQLSTSQIYDAMIVSLGESIHESDVKQLLQSQQKKSIILNDIFSTRSIKEQVDVWITQIKDSKCNSIYSEDFVHHVQQFALHIEEKNVEQYSDVFLNWLLERNENMTDTLYDFIRRYIPQSSPMTKYVQSFNRKLRDKNSVYFQTGNRIWKQALQNIHMINPSNILFNSKRKPVVLDHWSFSETHNSILTKQLVESYQWIKDLQNDKILKIILEQRIFDSNMSNNTYVLCNELFKILPLQLEKYTYETNRCLTELYMYLYLGEMYDLVESLSFESIEELEGSNPDETIFSDALRKQNVFEDEDIDIHSEYDQNLIFKSVAMYLAHNIHDLEDASEYALIDPNKLKEQMNHIRNEEKMQMIEELERLYGNNIEIKNAMKTLKLGRYNVDMNNILKYKPEFFDEEVKHAQHIAEYELQNNNLRTTTQGNIELMNLQVNGVNDLDAHNEHYNQQLEDEERHGMQNVDDDDYPEDYEEF